MTLQNGLVHGGSAYLWTRRAFFDLATGKLLCFDSKAMQGLNWPWGGVFSSIGGNPHEIAFEIGHAWPADVPSLLAATSQALRSYAVKGYAARVLLATCADQPQLWLLGTDDCAGEGAFNPCEVVHYMNTGQHVPECQRAIRRGLTPKRMRRAIDAQLANPYELASGGAGRVWYGGELIELEVSQTGVEARSLRAIEPLAEAA